MNMGAHWVIVRTVSSKRGHSGERAARRSGGKDGIFASALGPTIAECVPSGSDGIAACHKVALPDRWRCSRRRLVLEEGSTVGSIGQKKRWIGGKKKRWTVRW